MGHHHARTYSTSCAAQPVLLCCSSAWHESARRQKRARSGRGTVSYRRDGGALLSLGTTGRECWSSIKARVGPVRGVPPDSVQYRPCSDRATCVHFNRFQELLYSKVKAPHAARRFRWFSVGVVRTKLRCRVTVRGVWSVSRRAVCCSSAAASMRARNLLPSLQPRDSSSRPVFAVAWRACRT